MLIINYTQNSKYIFSRESQLKLEHSLVEATNRYRRVEEYAKDFVEGRYLDYSCHGIYHYLLSYAHAYINIIPVVFVTKAQSNKSFIVDLRTPIFNYNQIYIPDDKLIVPKIPTTSLSEMAESERFRFKEEELDLWGLYTLQDGGPVIFIWVDKIYEYTEKCDKIYERTTNFFPRHRIIKYYELHACQTILHEIMHALMDIDIFGHYHGHLLDKAFYDLKEESLAEAGSIALMKKYWSLEDIYYLLDFIGNKNLFQYSLGSKLYRTGVSVVEFSVDNWVGLKNGYNAFHWTEFKKWIKYIASNPKYNLKTLFDFENRIFY